MSAEQNTETSNDGFTLVRRKYSNNKFIYGDSILVGSNNITNDLARGVSTTLESAERLKTLYSSLISSPSDEFEIIEIEVG